MVWMNATQIGGGGGGAGGARGRGDGDRCRGEFLRVLHRPVD